MAFFMSSLANLIKPVQRHLAQRLWPATLVYPPQGHQQRWTLSQSDVDTIRAIDNKILMVRPPKQSMFGHEPRNHPKSLEIERACDKWLIENLSWLFKNDEHMGKLLRNHLTGFMTHTVPDADKDLLILSTDIFNYIFIFDDFLFDSLHADLKRMEIILAECAQLLSNPTSPRPSSTYWAAIFQQNLLSRMHEFWPRKYIRDFYVEWNKYMWISLQQAQMVRCGRVDMDWDQILVERYYNQGLNFTMSIIQPCVGVDILAGMSLSDKCRKFLQLTGQFVCFGNDLHSFKKEVLIEKFIINSVWVYKMLNQVSWHRAIDCIANTADRCLIDATNLVDEIRRESNDLEIQKWLDQVVPVLQWLPNGFCEWAINQSERYTHADKTDECALTNFRPQHYWFAQNSPPKGQLYTAEEEGSQNQTSTFLRLM